MDNSIGHLNSTDSITLVDGTTAEIGLALKQLGASGATIAKASVSFLVKLPGAQVSRVEGGFQVGKSILPELQSTTVVTEGTRGKFARLLDTSNKYYNTPANDE